MGREIVSPSDVSKANERYAKALEVVEVVRSHHFRIDVPGISVHPLTYCDGCCSGRCAERAALVAFDEVVDDSGTTSSQRVQEPALGELLAGRPVIIYAPDATNAEWWRSRGYTVWP